MAIIRTPFWEASLPPSLTSNMIYIYICIHSYIAPMLRRCDICVEFAPLPRKQLRPHTWQGDIQGCLHLCPVCVRKLQYTCGFDLRERYSGLQRVYSALGLGEQARWCAEVIRIGDVWNLANTR